MLLTSDKAAANFSDRSLLKNLGHWLGMITLAKNKPILHTVSTFWCALNGVGTVWWGRRWDNFWSGEVGPEAVWMVLG